MMTLLITFHLDTQILQKFQARERLKACTKDWVNTSARENSNFQLGNNLIWITLLSVDYFNRCNKGNKPLKTKTLWNKSQSTLKLNENHRPYKFKNRISPTVNFTNKKLEKIHKLLNNIKTTFTNNSKILKMNSMLIMIKMVNMKINHCSIQKVNKKISLCISGE